MYWVVKGYNLKKTHTQQLTFLSLKIDSALANSADPNKMPHYMLFYLGLHCYPSMNF